MSLTNSLFLSPFGTLLFSVLGVHGTAFPRSQGVGSGHTMREGHRQISFLCFGIYNLSVPIVQPEGLISTVFSFYVSCAPLL